VLIAAFDGRNVTLIADALELKILNEVLRNAKTDIFTTVANTLAMDGFKMEEQDVAAYTRAANLVLKSLMSGITLKAEDDSEPDDNNEQVLIH
jgi:hypothetical protein